MEEVGERVRAADLADWLLAHGRTSITTGETAELLDIPADQVRVRLHVPSRRGELVSPARGLWIPVPPQSPDQWHFPYLNHEMGAVIEASMRSSTMSRVKNLAGFPWLERS